MRAALGQPVAACSDGVVVLTGDFYFAGGSVYVDHGNGMISMYFHLSEVKVSIGQTVNRGDVVGLAGATGRVNGPHLHFGVALQGRLVDPEPLFSSRVDDLFVAVGEGMAKKATYEDRLARLTAIVEELEKGDAPLGARRCALQGRTRPGAVSARPSWKRPATKSSW